MPIRFARAQNPVCPRELPTCSWKDRTLTDTERCDTCHPPTAAKTLLQQMTEHAARCTRQNNQRDCNHPVGGTADTLFFDPHGNGFCRWEANDPVNAPCGLGKCVFDDACTSFSPAESCTGKCGYKLENAASDHVENAMDAEGAEWIWVNGDHVQDSTCSSKCSELGYGRCTQETCEAVDPTCKWDPDARNGPCRAEIPKKDEDTVYCRKNVRCTDYEMVDKATGNAITCDEAVANQQRNLTEGCGRCEMCRSLAYQSPGEKATTTWCVQAEGEPCDAAYKSPICIDPHVRMFPILPAKLLPYKTFRQHCLAYPAVK